MVEILGEEGRRMVLRALRYLDLPPALTARFRESLPACGLTALGVIYMPHLQFIDATITDSRTLLPWVLSGTLRLEEELALMYLSNGSREELDEGNNQLYEHYGDANEQYLRYISKDTFANCSFPYLTEVWIRVGGQDGYIPVWVVELLFLHPMLKILRTQGMNGSKEEIQNLKWPARNCNLEYLDLTETLIDYNGLENVLTRCQRLKGLFVAVDVARWSRGRMQTMGIGSLTWKDSETSFNNTVEG
ncbi:hypothetical protein FOXYSP1_08319 [Fusarium oxysporum f. sp. phaseoli]